MLGPSSQRYRRWWTYGVIFAVLLHLGGVIVFLQDLPIWWVPMLLIALVLAHMTDQVFPAESEDGD